MLNADVWSHILHFLTPNQRLRFVAAMELSSTATTMPDDIDLAVIPRDQILALYRQGVIPCHTTVDGFIWQCIQKDAVVSIRGITTRRCRNTERHFTEEWNTYGGTMTCSRGQTLTIDAPRNWDSHFVDHLVAMTRDRGENCLSYGYADW